MEEKEINETVKRYFNEILRETYEGQELAKFMRGERTDPITPQRLSGMFKSVWWKHPDSYSYMETIEALFKDVFGEEDGEDVRLKMIKDTLREPYKKYVWDRFVETMGYDLEKFPIKGTFIHAPANFEPTMPPSPVVLLEIYTNEFGLCRTYNLETGEETRAYLSELSPFDFDEFTKRKLEWNLENHKQETERIQEEINRLGIGREKQA